MTLMAIKPLKCTVTVRGGCGEPSVETINVDRYFKKYYPDLAGLKTESRKAIFERHERSCYKAHLQIDFKWNDREGL